MGCSTSKLEDEEAVQLCRDRKNFIKQAIDNRNRFASGHVAYIQSLRRVSVALRNYVDGDDQHGDFLSDSFSASPFTPVKRLSPEMGKIPLGFSPLKSIQSEKCAVHYTRSGGNASVSVEERPPRMPETVRISSYYYNYQHNPMEQHYGMESIFGFQAPSPMNQPVFPPPSPYNRPNYPPPSPSNSQWDFFWNPFASLESYGYPGQDSLIRTSSVDEMAGLRQVREEEGIPDLEEEDDGDNDENDDDVEPVLQPTKPVMEEERKSTSVAAATTEASEAEQSRRDQSKELQSHAVDATTVTKDMDHAKKLVGKGEESVETSTPGFTVYVDRRPASMSDVMRDIEHQFTRICDSAHEVSVMLEASRAQCSSSSGSSELTAMKMLNPIALFCSASSRSSSSRFLQAPPCIVEDLYETCSDVSEDSYMVSGSHQSTLDRLYAWEKKLYEEVKSGERIRKAYEKKCAQLKNQDVMAEDPDALDKTRQIERDLSTRIKVSIHSIEAISRRIETLRDEELHPQIMELLQGLARMWRTMADCHMIQKRVIDEAKLLLATPKLADRPPPVTRLGRSTTNLEFELRNWRSCLQTWICAQRSYVHALTGWILCCAPPQDQSEISPLSPPRSSGEPPIFRVCIHWSRLVESVSEAQAVEGLDFFAAGVASMVAQQREAEEARRRQMARGAVEEDGGEAVAEEAVSLEKVAEVGVRVVCAGMSVAVGGLANMAVKCMEGCEDLARGTPQSPPPTSV